MKYGPNLYLRIPIALVAFFFMGGSIYLSLAANLGTLPWAVFDVGVSNHVPLTIGRISQLGGLIIIVLSYLLEMKPRIGTFLNMFFIGFFYDLVAAWEIIPIPLTLGARYLYLITSIVIFGIGTGLYISLDIGTGPRDSLMMGLAKRFVRSLQSTRAFLELFALSTGFLLGGPVGIGTLLFALGIGPVVQRSLHFFRKNLSWRLDGPSLKPSTIGKNNWQEQPATHTGK